MGEKQRKRRRPAPADGDKPPTSREDTQVPDEVMTKDPPPLDDAADLADGPAADAQPVEPAEPAPEIDLGEGDAGEPRADEEAAVEESAGLEEEPKMRALDRKDVLARLLEKNEIILRLTKENSEREAQLRELNDKWIRSVAEFENYRKRTRKEWELLKQQAKSEIILDILSVVDDFERAFTVVEDDESSEFIQGIRLIYNNLTHTLERFGVSEVESLQQPFDPAHHMAVGQADAKGVRSGHVVEVIQKGYRLEDTVIRPARVIVAK